MRTSLYFIMVFLLTSPSISDAQKQDFVWLSGHTFNDLGGATFLKFTDCSYETEWVVQKKPMKRDAGSQSTMADKDGNLLFYTDGYDIFNSEHQIMENGDSLFNYAPPGYSDFYELPGGFNDFGRNLILPLPNSDYKFILFSQDYEWVLEDFRGSKAVNINYSLIDLRYNDNLGMVKKKREILIENDFESGQLKAIRHANGRDWWLVVKAWEQSKWYMFILDPDGIRLSHVEEVNELPDFGSVTTRYNYPEDNFYLIEKPDAPLPFDQDWYDNQFYSFHFDRCKGLLTYSGTFIIKTKTYVMAENGLTFDQTGKYIYGSSMAADYLFRYKINSGDTFPEIILYGDELDYLQANGIYQPKLTPQGELWIKHWADSLITIVRNPELPGVEINIDPEPITTAWLNQGKFPNNANYRIGPIDGSPCDTLGINNEPVAWYRYNGMNLDHLERRFTDISYFRPEQWHWDFDDGTTYDGQHPGVHEFPGPGEYYVCLTVSNEFAEDTYCKWVVIDSLVSTTEPIVRETDFRLYPNPGTGDFTLELSDPLTSPATLTVVDMLGREVHRETTSAGSADIQLSLSGNLPPGRYAITLQNEDGVLRGDLVLVR